MTGTDLVPLEPAPRLPVVYDPAAHRRARAQVDGGLWRKLRRYGRKVPFVKDALAAYFCARDPATPFQVKAVLMAALAYFVMPADMVPDFIAGLGFTDDATVLLAAIQTISPHIKDRHKARAQAAVDRLIPDEPADAAAGLSRDGG